MSYTFIFSGSDSILTKRFYPPIILEEDATYVLGLIDFLSSNTITNIDEKINENNKFFIGDYELELEEGTYEIEDIEKTILNMLEEKEGSIHEGENNGNQQTKHVDLIKYDVDKNELRPRVKRKLNDERSSQIPTKRQKKEKTTFKLKVHYNTFKCEIQSNKEIDFERPGTIASLLGFKNRKLAPNIHHFSDVPIKISKINSICVDCGIVRNSFFNGKAVHILHMLYPNVAPGYKIVEKPSTIIYLPITTRYIDEIELKIVDQSGGLVNFKGELITIRLHLKKL